MKITLMQNAQLHFASLEFSVVFSMQRLHWKTGFPGDVCLVLFPPIAKSRMIWTLIVLACYLLWRSFCYCVLFCFDVKQSYQLYNCGFHKSPNLLKAWSGAKATWPSKSFLFTNQQPIHNSSGASQSFVENEYEIWD